MAEQKAVQSIEPNITALANGWLSINAKDKLFLNYS